MNDSDSDNNNDNDDDTTTIYNNNDNDNDSNNFSNTICYPEFLTLTQLPWVFFPHMIMPRMTYRHLQRSIWGHSRNVEAETGTARLQQWLQQPKI